MSDIKASHSPIFYSIPIEIFEKIVQHVDKKDALSLALTSPRLTAAAEPVLWQSLRLSLPAQCGAYPLIQSADRGGRKTSDLWAKRMAREAEERHRAGIKRRVQAILDRGDERRWRLVTKVVLVSRPSAVKGMVQILEACAANIQDLTIEAPAENVYEAAWLPEVIHGIDYALFRRPISFGSLTRLTIGPSSIQHSALLVNLCESAPSLTRLDVDMRQRHKNCPRSDMRSTALPRSGRQIGLREMRFIFDDLDGRATSNDVAAVFIHLLSRCSDMDRLCVELEIGDGPQAGHVLAAIGDHPHVQSLYSSLHPCLLGGWESGNPGCATVERVVVQPLSEADIMQYLPDIPNLEILYFKTPTQPLVTSDKFPTILREVQATALADQEDPIDGIVPSFARDIRNMPRLRALHTLPPNLAHGLDIFPQLDAIEESGDFNGHIWSWKHGNDGEVLHVRLLSHYREIADCIPTQSLRSKFDTPGITHFEYVTKGQEVFTKLYCQLPEPIWNDMTDMYGLRVPLEVIEDMRQAEGVGIEAWRVRGYEVGDAAWQVLMDWAERRVAEDYEE